LNPARAEQLPSSQALREFQWSSLPFILGAPEKRPAWLHVGRVFEECGIVTDSPAGRREFERRVEALRHDASRQDFEEIRKAWCFSDDQFRQESLAKSVAAKGHHYY